VSLGTAPLPTTGLHYSTSPEGFSGVELRVDGFSHKLPVLARRLVECAAKCEVGVSGQAAVSHLCTCCGLLRVGVFIVSVSLSAPVVFS